MSTKNKKYSKKDFMTLTDEWENYDEDENGELYLDSVDWELVWKWIKQRDKLK